MGQRLVISVYASKEIKRPLAKIYYHWSAYTISALMIARNLINELNNENLAHITDIKLKLIRAVENLGGGIDGKDTEFRHIENMYPNEKFKTDGYSRNNGLIALSSKNMNSMQGYSDGNLNIYLEEKEIQNYVLFGYENIKDYNEDRAEWDEDFTALKLEDLPEVHYNISQLLFSDIDNCIKELETIENNYNYVYRYKNEVIEIII